MGCYAVGDSLWSPLVTVGLVVDIDRWDFEVEFRRYQIGRSWRFVIGTELETSKHLHGISSVLPLLLSGLYSHSENIFGPQAWQ